MEIFNSIGAQVISFAVAGLCGWLVARVRQLNKRDAALYSGMKALLRKELMNDFETYVVNKRPLSVERKREIDECYEAYSSLGGNGTGKQMYEKLCNVKVQV